MLTNLNVKSCIIISSNKETKMNEQDNYQSQASEPIVISHGSKHGKLKKVLRGFLLLLLIAGLGVLGYLYYLSSSQVSKLEAEKLSLSKSLDEKNKQLAGADGDSGAAAGSCKAGAEYQAEIGKFKVTLDSPRVVVRNLDAGFEGGPATQLEVASCLEDEKNVYDNPPTQEVTILANPNVSLADLKSGYESNAGGASSSSEEVTIDGVTANKHMYSGLFETAVIFFENDGISYQIELSDNTSEEGKAILEDVVSDWKFVSS